MVSSKVIKLCSLYSSGVLKFISSEYQKIVSPLKSITTTL